MRALSVRLATSFVSLFFSPVWRTSGRIRGRRSRPRRSACGGSKAHCRVPRRSAHSGTPGPWPR
eukprot:1644369-Heterocapsa_arctica.AAC.1